MIDTCVLPEVEIQDISSKNTKLSDWVRSQSPTRFCSRYVKYGYRMCGLGIVADFYGIDWQSIKEPTKVYSIATNGVVKNEGFDGFYSEEKVLDFLKEVIGYLPFDGSDFDSIYNVYGPKEARDWVVNQLVELGL